MKKCNFLLVIILMLTLQLGAQNRKYQDTTYSPDDLPNSLSSDAAPQVMTPVHDTVYVNYIDVTTPLWDRYNHNSVPVADPSTWKGNLQNQLDYLCNTAMFETSQLGFYVYDLTADEDLYAINYRHRMRPASCEKLVTSITALDVLGCDYTFDTDLLVTGTTSGSSLGGDLYVVARMDPLLSRGDVRSLAKQLLDKGIKSIRGNIFIDLSFREAKEYGRGWCWDDNWGPLCTLTVDGHDSFAQEFLSALSSVGISVKNRKVGHSTCPSSATQVARVSHTFDEVLETMMKESDNIFAESVFYHIAAHGGNRNAGREQATRRIASFIESRLEMDPSVYRIVDGSGLSLYNYVSPELLVRLLTFAWQNEEIRSHLYPALPVAGVDGTLKNRMKGTPAEKNVHAKTGTVNGVTSLSGYAMSAAGHVIVFSIINQGIFPASPGREFQNKVCQLLCQ